MNRPEPKSYTPKEHLRGVYADALDKYIDHLESKNDSVLSSISQQRKLLEAFAKYHNGHSDVSYTAIQWDLIDKFLASNSD